MMKRSSPNRVRAYYSTAALCLFLNSGYSLTMRKTPCVSIITTTFLALLIKSSLLIAISVVGAVPMAIAAPLAEIIAVAHQLGDNAIESNFTHSQLKQSSCAIFGFSGDKNESSGMILSEGKSQAALQSVQEHYQRIRTVKASFQQRSYLKSLDLEELSSGNLLLEMPGKLFWEYQKPESQTFLLLNNEFQLYQPVDQQLIVQNVASSFTSDIPVSFLLGVGDLSKRFSVIQGCQRGEAISLTLIPNLNDAGALKTLKIRFHAEDYFPETTEIVDADGNRTTVRIYDRALGVPLSVKDFQINIPDGTDIQDLRDKVRR